MQGHAVSKKWSQHSHSTPCTLKVCVKPLCIVLSPLTHPLLEGPVPSAYPTLASRLALSACPHLHNQRVPAEPALCLPDPLACDSPWPHRIFEEGCEGASRSANLWWDHGSISQEEGILCQKEQMIGFNISAKAQKVNHLGHVNYLRYYCFPFSSSERNLMVLLNLTLKSDSDFPT